jgi:hypothetical protein
MLAGGLVLAPYSHTAESAAHKVLTNVLLAAGSIIFIDGNGYPDGSERMATELGGQYQYAPCASAGCTPLSKPTTKYLNFINDTSVYPATLGLYNGLGSPSGNQSIADGQNAIAHQIAYEQSQGNTPITVVAYSEGAVAASHEVSQYPSNGNVAFVLIADAERPNGGILARLPAGTYIPLLGITGGGATSSTGAPVVMVTQQYDGIADAPAYPLNVVADANAVLGFVYLHPNYESVNPTTGDGAGTIVTTSGNMTDILVLAPVGQLPLEMPLAQVGVPQPILVALDPALRSIIETGYDRTSDPSQQVMFALLPPVSAIPGDAASVVVGFVTTAQELPGAIVASVPGTSSLVVVPLKTVTPASSPLAVNALPMKPSVPQTQQVSDVQPSSQPQQAWQGPPKVLTNQTDTPATGQQPTQDQTASSTNNSPPNQASTQPANRTAPKLIPNPKATGNKFNPGSTTAAGGTSSNGSNPLQGAAVTGVTNAIGSVTSSLTKAVSGGGSTSHTTSGSQNSRG